MATKLNVVVAVCGLSVLAGPLERAEAQVQTVATQAPLPLVEVFVIAKDRTSNAPITATIYSAGNCPTYTMNCRFFGVHSAPRSPAKVSCPDGYKIYARTDSNKYHAQSTPADCYQGASVELLFSRYSDETWLEDAGKALIKLGKANIATVVFSERNQLKPSQDAFEDVLNSAAIALQVDPKKALYFDRQQEKNVASPDLVAAIKKFQETKGLTADGILGSQTLQMLADGKPSPTVIRQLAVQPQLAAPN